MAENPLRLEAVPGSAWDALGAGFADFSLTQTLGFGDAKAATGPWRAERHAVVAGSTVVGAAQALVRDLPAGLGGLVWINRAPLWRRPGDAGDPALAARVLECLCRHYARERGYYLRIAPACGGDLPVAMPDGAVPAGTPGWASAVVDLTPPPEALRAGLDQKWRNALNKAEREGPAVDTADDAAAFDVFADHYSEWLAARGFATTVTPDLLRALRPRLRLRPFLARAGGAVVGSALIARFGDVAEYLAGTTTESGRGAGQALLWTAMLWARADGATRFDVGGMDSDLTPAGIYRFKSGLGGAPYRLAPEIEALPGPGLRGLTARLVRRRVAAARRAG